MTKVLIADDHEIVRKGLQIQFRTIPNIDVIGEVSDGEKVLDFLRYNEVDIILLDIDMPKVNGITISPKKNFCIIKIWLNNCANQNPETINYSNIEGFTSYGSLFKKHL